MKSVTDSSAQVRREVSGGRGLAMAHLVYPSAPALTDNDIESKEKYNKEKES